MPQIFPPSMNTISKVSIVRTVLISLGCVIVLTSLFRSRVIDELKKSIHREYPNIGQIFIEVESLKESRTKEES